MSSSLLFSLISYFSFINMQLERATVTNRNTGNLEFADYRISKRYRKSRLKYFVNNYICNGVADRLCGLLSRSTILSIRFGHTSFARYLQSSFARYLQFTDSLKLLLKEIISHRFPVHSISLCLPFLLLNGDRTRSCKFYKMDNRFKRTL